LIVNDDPKRDLSGKSTVYNRSAAFYKANNLLVDRHFVAEHSAKLG